MVRCRSLRTCTAAAFLALAGGTMAATPPPHEAAVAALRSEVESASSARTSAIPEPVSLAVFGTGLLLLLRRRRF